MLALAVVAGVWLGSGGGSDARGSGGIEARKVASVERPARVAVGGGHVWTLEPGTRRLRSVAVGTEEPAKSVVLGARGDIAADVTATAGAAWVALARGGRGLVVRVPRAGGRRRVVPVPTAPQHLLVGREAFWVLGEDRLASVPRGGRGARWERAIPSARAMASGYGSLWVLSRRGAALGESLLLRVDPADGGVIGRRRVPGPGTAVAVGLGEVWVANGCPGGWLRAPVGPGPARCEGPAGGLVDLAVGLGAMWGADEDGGAVVHARPDGPTRRVPLPVRPTAVAVGEEAAWAVSRRGGLYRIGPREDPPPGAPDEVRRDVLRAAVREARTPAGA